MKVGFIGLGSLGTPIAMNILERGHELYVYNRTSAKTIPLSSKGAIVCGSVQALARLVDIVLTIVSDDAALKEICGGEYGLISNLKPGAIHVSMSTILPATALALSAQHAEHSQQYIASPVFGRPEAAADRKINFVLSGPEATRNKVEPLLKDAGGAGVWHFGNEISVANTIKLCGNFLIAGALQAIGESVNLATQSGVDAHQMWNMFSQTLFNAPVYHNYSKIILDKKFEPAAFTAKLGLKDLNLVLTQAASVHQAMPLAQLLQHNMQQLVSEGKQDIDWSAVSTAVDKNI